MASISLAIIDDEPEMEDIYCLMLEPLIQAGSLKMNFFQDARDFLEWFGEFTPDLILCDINMPYMNGPELCEIIRRSRQKIPIAFVSGDSPQEHQGVMERLKIDSFISKPLSSREVLRFCGGVPASVEL